MFLFEELVVFVFLGRGLIWVHEGVNVVIHFRQTPSMKTVHGGRAEEGKGRERGRKNRTVKEGRTSVNIN